MAKKKAPKSRLVYVLRNGDRYDVTGENGKYYLCEGNTQFRKSAKRGELIKEAIPEADKPAEETEG